MTYDKATVMFLSKYIIFAHSCSALHVTVSSFGAFTCPVHPILCKAVWKNMHFFMFFSISASLGLRSSTAVHISENSNILDSSTAILALFFNSPPFFPGGKVGQFLLGPVATLLSCWSSVATLPVTITAQWQTGSTLCCAVPQTCEIGNVLSEGPAAVLGKWRICLWGSHSDRQKGLGHGSKFWLFSWDSALAEETASIWLLLKATELVYSSLRVKRLLREVF